MPLSKVQRRLAALQFINAEAEESEHDKDELDQMQEEEEEEEEEEEKEGEGEYLTDLLPGDTPLFQPNRRSDEEFGALVDSFLPDPNRPHGLRNDMSNVPEYFERISVPGDYPLWRIKCRKHTEEEALVSLFKTAKQRHELRSVFSKEPGHLYLECTMNTSLVELLQKTPGIITDSRESVPQLDYRETLAISRPSDISNGLWVQILKGPYKGDVGLVVEKRIDGAEVILIPRLPPPLEMVKSNKRKYRKVIYPPLVFDPDVYKKQFPREVSLKSEGVYVFRRRTFENGLERKLFKQTFLKANPIDIPYKNFKIFLENPHPNIRNTCIPRPREWLFAVDEKVSITSVATTPTGIIQKITPYHAVVEIRHNDNLHMWSYLPESREIPWRDLRKVISLGDYVKIQAGLHSGHVGWVLEIIDDIVTIADIEVTGMVLEPGQSHSVKKSVKAHINTLREYEIPHHYTPTNEANPRKLNVSSYVLVTAGRYLGLTGWITKTEGEIALVLENMPEGGAHKATESEHLEIPLKYLFPTQSSQVPGAIAPLNNTHLFQNCHPWEGLKVIVSKRYNASKGFQGTIMRVIPSQHELSETRIDVKSSTYNPSEPFATQTFKYDDVRERRTLKMLNEFNRVDPRGPVSSSETAETMDIGSSATPCYPSSDAATSPAWDPLSRTPGPSSWSPFSPSAYTLPSPSYTLPSPVYSPLSSPIGYISPSYSAPTPSYSPFSTSPYSPFSTSPYSPLSSSASPLWNGPGGSTPSHVPSTSSQHANNLKAAPSHPFLNEALHGVSLRAMVGGKEGVVSVDAVDGRCSIRRKEYRSSVLVQPELVTPKQPNPAKDNGLLVVIKGEHAMKFVRRIHHRTKVPEKPMILAVCVRSENDRDELSGEQFELTADHLCVVVESDKSKELNQDVMNVLREQYRGKKL